MKPKSKWYVQLSKQIGIYPLLHTLKSRIFELRFGKLNSAQFDIRGHHVRFRTEDDYSKRWFFPRYTNGRIHEPSVTNCLLDVIAPLQDTDCLFIDVGANLGFYTCTVAALMPQAKIVAFEMDRANFALLEQNVAFNGLNNVTLGNCAVSSTSGDVTYSHDGDSPSQFYSLGTSATQGKLSTTIPSTSLDTYFQNYPTVPIVCKIDVEGAELDVLDGMHQLLKHPQCQIIIEIHPNRMRQLFKHEPSQLIAKLHALDLEALEIIEHPENISYTLASISSEALPNSIFTILIRSKRGITPN